MRNSNGCPPVRRAGAGETLVTLDGVERTFVPDDLLICDGLDQVFTIIKEEKYLFVGKERQ